MNFKSLKNEKEYKNNIKWVKIFEDLIEHLAGQCKKTSDFIFFAEHAYYMKHIMEAEIQDYEHREKGGYL